MTATERGRTNASRDANPAFAGAASAVMDVSPMACLRRLAWARRGATARGRSASLSRGGGTGGSRVLVLLVEVVVILEVVEVLVLVEFLVLLVLVLLVEV